MKTSEDLEKFSLPTEIWVVATKRHDGLLPDPCKILGMAYPKGPTDKRWGESVFFHSKEDAEGFLAAIDEALREYFGVFQTWIEIKRKV
jgi:hypothetical protein